MKSKASTHAIEFTPRPSSATTSSSEGGNTVGPYAVILGPCQIGDGNWIGPHVAIGTPGEIRGGPHPAAWEGDDGTGRTVIGDRNIIREFTTVQQGHVGATRIGDDCYIMTKSHVPHDGVLRDRVTISCSVMIGGHSVIGSDANVGLGSVIHQHLAIGQGAMVGMGSVVTKNVLPYAMCFGNPARVRGAHTVGLRRIGVAEGTIEKLSAALLTDTDLGDLIPMRWMISRPSNPSPDTQAKRSNPLAGEHSV